MRNNNYLAAVFKAADNYYEHLLNRNLLFVYQESPRKIDTMETVFMDYNFMHLTGVVFKKGHEMLPTKFFERCMDRKLKADNMLLREDGTTIQKLNVLPEIFNPSLSAKMVGVYKGGRINLMSERMTGGIRGAVGFVKDRGLYYPNTIIEGDIRSDIDRPRRVLAVFRKATSDDKYLECTYIAKKVDLSKLSISEPFSYLGGEENSEERGE